MTNPNNDIDREHVLEAQAGIARDSAIAALVIRRALRRNSPKVPVNPRFAQSLQAILDHIRSLGELVNEKKVGSTLFDSERVLLDEAIPLRAIANTAGLNPTADLDSEEHAEVWIRKASSVHLEDSGEGPVLVLTDTAGAQELAEGLRELADISLSNAISASRQDTPQYAIA